MATFAGVDIFGPQVRMRVSPLPKAVQENHYPGATGVESLDLGGVGGIVHCEGWLVAPDAISVGALEQIFIDFQQDGGAYVLVDTQLRIWTNVILKSFDPGDLAPQAWDGFNGAFTAAVARYYTATFRILQ